MPPGQGESVEQKGTDFRESIIKKLFLICCAALGMAVGSVFIPPIAPAAQAMGLAAIAWGILALNLKK
ncbi:MAG: hypothetical protein HYT39_01265 [Candidatus Sungbacteria bacterium]|nr:hypothetical protein [Candidatus Sungbacteria bacterium]